MTLTRSLGQGQGQGHGAFELPTTSEAVHAGGDDRSPLAGLSGLILGFIRYSANAVVTSYFLLGEEAEASPSIANTLWRV